MNVIFLDIDGVLNSDATPNPRKFPYIVDPGLLAIFKDLVSRTGATVVLSSSWRTDPVGLLAAKFYGVPFVDVSCGAVSSRAVDFPIKFGVINRLDKLQAALRASSIRRALSARHLQA